MQIITKRRAIYTALSQYLSPTETLLAVQLWEKEFVDTPSFLLSRFIVKCCKTDDLKKLRSEMLNAVTLALKAPREELLDDPGSQINYEPNVDEKQNAQHLADAKNIMFTTLIKHLWSNLDEATERSLQKFTLVNLAHIKLAPALQSHLSDWIISKHNPLTCNLQLEILQKVVTLTYTGLCEHFGPIKADQMLAQAIRDIEPQAIAIKFNLHDLL